MNFDEIMARSAYAVYIIHPLVLVSVSLFMMNVTLPSGLKFLITGTISVVISFVIGQLLVKVPLVKDVV